MQAKKCVLTVGVAACRQRCVCVWGGGEGLLGWAWPCRLSGCTGMHVVLLVATQQASLSLLVCALLEQSLTAAHVSSVCWQDDLLSIVLPGATQQASLSVCTMFVQSQLSHTFLLSVVRMLAGCCQDGLLGVGLLGRGSFLAACLQQHQDIGLQRHVVGSGETQQCPGVPGGAVCMPFFFLVCGQIPSV
jgi:hypothetical protein